MNLSRYCVEKQRTMTNGQPNIETTAFQSSVLCEVCFSFEKAST